jgi:hypothetical protein
MNCPNARVLAIRIMVKLQEDNILDVMIAYNYSVEIKSTASSMFVKRQALQLYFEGLGFRSIGSFLGVSHVSVQKWI